jgi:hypothetical protein
MNILQVQVGKIHFMGQYSQWLHYREVEQLLQAQLETLNQQLAQLQARAEELQASPRPAEDAARPEHVPARPGDQPLEGAALSSYTDNPIIAALALSFAGRAHIPTSDSLVNGTIARPTNGPGSPAGARGARGAPETISSALFAWGNLPNFGVQQDPLMSGTDDHPTSMAQEQPELLPEDMLAFCDQHAPTDPQLELPHWLRPIANAAGAQHPDAPVDQESVRTNRLVQRWIERWGRQPAARSQQGRTSHE